MNPFKQIMRSETNWEAKILEWLNPAVTALPGGGPHLKLMSSRQCPRLFNATSVSQGFSSVGIFFLPSHLKSFIGRNASSSPHDLYVRGTLGFHISGHFDGQWTPLLSLSTFNSFSRSCNHIASLSLIYYDAAMNTALNYWTSNQ